MGRLNGLRCEDASEDVDVNHDETNHVRFVADELYSTVMVNPFNESYPEPFGGSF